MHGFPFINSPFAAQPAAIFIPLILVALLWTIILKGYALWYSARAKQKGWFICLLIINTLGLLEIVYLIWFRRTPQKMLTLRRQTHHRRSSDRIKIRKGGRAV